MAFIINAGTPLYTLDSNIGYFPETVHYVSYIDSDIRIYQKEFPKEIREREGNVPCFSIISRAIEGIRIAEINESYEVFQQLYSKNRKFHIQLGAMLFIFRDSFSILNRPLNLRENLVYQQLIKTTKKGASLEDIFDAFVISIEIDEPVFPSCYELFFNTMKQANYDGMLDSADMRYNTYHVERPVIICRKD